MADQLFKLKFQMNMGQTESLKKIRGLRRDIARSRPSCASRNLAPVRRRKNNGGDPGQPERQKHHKELIGTVVSNKMQKTIVVEVTRKKAHPM